MHPALRILAGVSAWVASASAAETVNAYDFGYDAADATAAIQAAIDSGAAVVLIPNLGQPWIVRPLFATRDHQEIRLEPGAELVAKADAFHGGRECLLTIKGRHDVAVIGHGATLRMRKADYQDAGRYTPSEHRHALSVSTSELDADGDEVGPGLATERITVRGLALVASGGDGLCLQGNVGYSARVEPLAPKDVLVADVLCDDNHRQGISVIAGERLLIRDSVLQRTRGTAPQYGIDWEPDWQPLRSVRLLNSLVRDNRTVACGLVLFRPVWKGDAAVSVTMDWCHLSGPVAGVVQRVADAGGPGGTVAFNDCVLSSALEYPAVAITDKSAFGARVGFTRCLFENRGSAAAPIELATEGWTDPDNGLDDPPAVSTGGVDFTACTLVDRRDRPAIRFVDGDGGGRGVRDVTGDLAVHSPHRARLDLGAVTSGISLTLGEHRTRPPEVALTAPTHLATVTIGETIRLAATASDADAGTADGAGIAALRLSVRRGEALVAAWDDAAAPFTADWSTAGLEPGIYLIRAEARSAEEATPAADAVAVRLLPRLASDLALIAVTADPAYPTSGQPATLRATVENHGAIATPLGVPVTVRFSVDGAAAGESTLPRFLASGERATVSLAWTATAGAGTLVAVVDPTGAIAQGDTGDDRATNSIASASVGTGTGLCATYYDNADFTGTSVPRVDATVDFDWGPGAPAPGIGADTFSVRWSGQVQAQRSETYTFTTRTDDGARLWVNGQQLVDRWVDQGASDASGTIALTAGRKYDVVMECYDNAGGAVARLSWSSPSTAKTVIPQTQLYPAAAASPPVGGNGGGGSGVGTGGGGGGGGGRGCGVGSGLGLLALGWCFTRARSHRERRAAGRSDRTSREPPATASP